MINRQEIDSMEQLRIYPLFYVGITPEIANRPTLIVSFTDDADPDERTDDTSKARCLLKMAALIKANY